MASERAIVSKVKNRALQREQPMTVHRAIKMSAAAILCGLSVSQFQTAALARTAVRIELPLPGAYAPNNMCVWSYGRAHTYACLNDHGLPHCGCWPDDRVSFRR
jgi:hypothetical protein